MNEVYNFFIPFRNRPTALKIFLEEFPKSLVKRDYIQKYNIIIVEQSAKKLFNLGKLNNVGFDWAKNGGLGVPYSEEDVFVFHPIDLLPTDSPIEKTNYKFEEIGFAFLCDPEYHWGYPKAIVGQNKYIEKINGFANCFYGWGGEDENFFLRCVKTESNYINRQVVFIENEEPGFRGITFNWTQDILEEMNHEIFLNESVCNSGLNTLRYKVNDVLKMGENVFKINVDL